MRIFTIAKIRSPDKEIDKRGRWCWCMAFVRPGRARGVFLFMSKRDCTEKNSRVVLERVSRGRYDKYIESHAFGTDLFVDSATLLTIDTFFSTYRTCRFNVFELNELTGLGILTGEVVLAIPT